MRKHLTPFGNSLGIVFERPILELTGITRETPLEVTWDGSRFLIEPIRDPEERGVPLPAVVDLGVDLTVPHATIPILDELVERGLDAAKFRQLHHLPYANIKAHRDYCGRDSKFQAGGTNVQTASRLLIALNKLKDGGSWDEAIVDALRAFPK